MSAFSVISSSNFWKTITENLVIRFELFGVESSERIWERWEVSQVIKKSHQISKKWIRSDWTLSFEDSFLRDNEHQIRIWKCRAYCQHLQRHQNHLFKFSGSYSSTNFGISQIATTLTRVYMCKMDKNVIIEQYCRSNSH